MYQYVFQSFPKASVVDACGLHVKKETHKKKNLLLTLKHTLFSVGLVSFSCDVTTSVKGPAMTNDNVNDKFTTKDTNFSYYDHGNPKSPDSQ